MGAYGGRRELMEQVAPLGKVYQAGTLSGNPIAMAAGIAQLTYLKEHPEVYAHLDMLAEKLFSGMKKMIADLKLPCTLNNIGSLGCLFFTEGPIRNYQEARGSDTAAYARYFTHMLSRGIYIAPAQFEAMFISDSHSIEHIEATLYAARDYFETKKE